MQVLFATVCRKKIEEIGKMTALSQDEIVSSTKTVIQGLDTLKNEHHQILNSLLSSLKTIKRESGDTNLVEEKTNILKKSLETIELGISEAQVGKRCGSVCVCLSAAGLWAHFLFVLCVCLYTCWRKCTCMCVVIFVWCGIACVCVFFVSLSSQVWCKICEDICVFCGFFFIKEKKSTSEVHW